MPCGFESHLSHQNSGYPLRGDRNFLFRDGTRKAVKKTCRWHVFRPWESPLNLRRIQYGCGSNSSMSDVKKSWYIALFQKVLIKIILIEWYISSSTITGSKGYGRIQIMTSKNYPDTGLCCHRISVCIWRWLP